MRRYRVSENLISVLIAVAISIPACIGAYRSQQIDTPADYRETKIEPVTKAAIIETEILEIEQIEPLDPPDPVIEEEPVNLDYLGEFTITAYCSCEKCCGVWATKRPDGIVYGASGAELTPGYSIAVDSEVIPYGTIVSINGKEYIAEDTGGAIRGNKIDLYMSTHAEAVEWGKQSFDVYRVTE